MEMKKRYLGLVGLLFLVLIFWHLDIGQVLEVLAKINPVLFLAAFFLEVFGVLLKGLKYKVVVKGHGKNLSLEEATKFFLIGFFISLVTPGRVGEISRAFYANSRINSIGKSVSSFVLDRTLDIGILIALGFVSALILSLGLGIEAVPIGIVALFAVLFFGGLFVLSSRRLLGQILKPFFHGLVPEGLKGKAKVGFAEFHSSFWKALKNKRQIGLALLTGIAAWIVIGFAFNFYLLALGLSVPLYFVFLLLAAINFVGNLPISFSGIGTREATAIALLAIFGVSATEAVAFSALVFAVGYVFTAAIGFALFTKESRRPDLGFLSQ